MWGQALKVAIVGFSVVFAGLWMLAISVKIMSYFCKLAEERIISPKGKVKKAES